VYEICRAAATPSTNPPFGSGGDEERQAEREELRADLSAVGAGPPWRRWGGFWPRWGYRPRWSSTWARSNVGECVAR